MNAVVARGSGRSSAVVSLWPSAAGAVLLGFTAPSTWAFDEETPAALIAQAGAPSSDNRLRPQLEITATSTPRFDSADGTGRASRIDMTLLAPRRSALGLSLGVNGTDGLTAPLSGSPAGQAPSVDLGLHWRYTTDGDFRLDVNAWRRLEQPDALSLIYNREPSYGARVEMRIGSGSRSGLVADLGFLGMQLQGGGRITVRKSGGKPMVYYRTKF
jgi:hypothetical protein